MILIVGASGKMGGVAARLLLARGERVRAMSRVPARLESLSQLGAEVVAGDLTDPRSVAAACRGADRVLAAAHAFTGTGANSSSRVDDAGNRGLIDAARAAGVGHFVFTSARCSPDDPVDFFRTKYAVEQHLRASGLAFTIVRAGMFMEDHAERLGRPAVERGWTAVLGPGRTPGNYVAADDVAQVAALVLVGPPADDVVWVGGPEELTPLEVIATYDRVSGRRTRVRHVPLGVVRALGPVLRPVFPVAARIIDAALFTDAVPQPIDSAETLRRFPIRLTSLEEFVRRRLASGAYGRGAPPARR